MAMRLRKETKKSSYYVWFLGAKEAQGVRGVQHIRPAVECLEQREKDVEPFKVTLQVSAKGLKIVQSVAATAAASSRKPKGETIKHFIPHHTVACVHQQDDIVACILLLFNPATKWPLHVHAYRCDSLETAAVLRAQLQHFVDRPDNQKKLAAVEARLLPPPRRLDSAAGSSDTSTPTTTSTRSESSDDRLSPGEPTAMASTLYDSVAAELRAKLGRRRAQRDDAPILLPPRDYDTVHRQRGNLAGIEMRRCLNASIVGQHAASGGSSGIGSDHAPSPEALDGASSDDDDDDWRADHDASPCLVVDHHHHNQHHHQQQQPWRAPGPGGHEQLTSPRDRFNDAKEKFLSLEKRAGMGASANRRSMLDLPAVPEREPFRYAHEAPISKELKRRSLMAFPGSERRWPPPPQPSPPSAVVGMNLPVSRAGGPAAEPQAAARFRNSFADPTMATREMTDGVADPPMGPFAHHNHHLHHQLRPAGRRFDVLQRTNSTLSNTGRVGIASVHPY